VTAPPLPADTTAGALDAVARRDLRGLQKDTAETVARHLVAAGTLVDEDPELALRHARYARHRASRIAVVREAAGITAYHAGEWSEALNDLRAARRMGGGPVHLAVMADIERALGRPERALDLARDPEAGDLDQAQSIELAIVAAGARRDLGELDAAVVGLQGPALDPARRDPWSPRLFYAYADNLLAAGRESEALQWFVHAADADDDGLTDAGERIAELTGEPLDVVLLPLIEGRPSEDGQPGVIDGSVEVEVEVEVEVVAAAAHGVQLDETTSAPASEVEPPPDDAVEHASAARREDAARPTDDVGPADPGRADRAPHADGDGDGERAASEVGQQ
jgi:tetratricopeptide (TPR) repeat protein